MNHRPETATAGHDNDFDPRQAAALLDQVTTQARRRFSPGPPLLWVYRAAFVLVAFGGYWRSVRGHNPYASPPGGLVAVIVALVVINIAWSTWALRRAGAGISGPAQRQRRAWIGAMLVVWIAAYAFTVPLYHASASHPAWALYPASAPLMIVGLVGAVTSAARRDWPTVGTTLGLAIIGAAAGFGGPAGAWLIMGIGLSAVCLGTAAFKVWQQRRSVVRP